MSNLKIAVTGATGYIGNHLVQWLTEKNHSVYSMGRKFFPGTNFIKFQLGQNNDYRELENVDVLIHCAYDFEPRDYATIRAVNYQGSFDLFQNAIHAGVK